MERDSATVGIVALWIMFHMMSCNQHPNETDKYQHEYGWDERYLERRSVEF
jgi:hypothetical protein